MPTSNKEVEALNTETGLCHLTQFARPSCEQCRGFGEPVVTLLEHEIRHGVGIHPRARQVRVLVLQRAGLSADW